MDDRVDLRSGSVAAFACGLASAAEVAAWHPAAARAIRRSAVAIAAGWAPRRHALLSSSNSLRYRFIAAIARCVAGGPANGE